jgi:hypothetical protein
MKEKLEMLATEARKALAGKDVEATKQAATDIQKKLK